MYGCLTFLNLLHHSAFRSCNNRCYDLSTLINLISSVNNFILEVISGIF
jgi:hypothetical protein